MNWETVAAEFEWDGALRDLYVLDTTLEHWNRLWRAFSLWPYPLRYELDGVTDALPPSVDEVFTARSTGHPMLTFDVGGVHINCHFFGHEELEFDLDPREVKDARSLAEVLGFMRQVGVALELPVRLTPENTRERPFLEYSPGEDRFTHTPVGVLR